MHTTQLTKSSSRGSLRPSRTVTGEQRLADAVDWMRVDRMLDFGGIRLEQSVLITEAECDVLTNNLPLFD